MEDCKDLALKCYFYFNSDIPNCIKSTNEGCKLLNTSLTFYMPKWNFQTQNKISTNPKNNKNVLKMLRILGFSISTWEMVTRKISAQQNTQAQIKKKKKCMTQTHWGDQWEMIWASKIPVQHNSSYISHLYPVTEAHWALPFTNEVEIM